MMNGLRRNRGDPVPSPLDREQATTTIGFSYDDNPNLTGNGTDSYSYDYANQLTSATVNSTTTDFAYDGDGVRASKTVGSTTTGYNYDRESGLPLLADDGSNAYLQGDGALAQIDSGGDPSYLLGDALGSVRGVTDDTGALMGTADYNAFGSVRASSGASSALGFTGEQSDPTTGLTYLRARYLDPAVGRFISADTVQPNAPGTQGYNVYTYVANNPTTWTDPSGHMAETALLDQGRQLLAIEFRMPTFITTLYNWCRTDGQGWCVLAVTIGATFPILVCAFDADCVANAMHDASLIADLGSLVPTAPRWRFPDLKDIPKWWPVIPAADAPKIVNAAKNVWDEITRLPTEETREHCTKYYVPCVLKSWSVESGWTCDTCRQLCMGQGFWPDNHCKIGKFYIEPATTKAVPWTGHRVYSSCTG